jgi:hypothetical protein
MTAAAAHVTEAHEELRAHVRALRGLIDRCPPPHDRLTWLAYLCLAIADFTEALAGHFEHEETDGAFHDLLQHRTELLSEVRRLGDQHRDMLVALDAVRCGLGELPLGEVTARLLRLLEDFERHEQAETALVQLAYGRDLGVGG